MSEELVKIQNRTRSIFQSFGVKKAAVFGSVSRGEQKRHSDIDILIDIKRPVGFIKLNSLQLSLEEELGQKVDLVEYDGVNIHMKPFIFKDAVTIYEE